MKSIREHYLNRITAVDSQRTNPMVSLSEFDSNLLNHYPDISSDPQISFSRVKNPYCPVMNAELHMLPVGRGMHALVFAKKLLQLFRSPEFPDVQDDSIRIELFVALKTNEKKLRLYSDKPIPALEEIGLNQEKGYYDIEFAYSGISGDRISAVNADDNLFFVRVNGHVRPCFMDGSHMVRNDTGLNILLMMVPTIFGVVIGALLFPGVGALIGAFVGFASGLSFCGLLGLTRQRCFFGGQDPERETTLAIFMTGAGAGMIPGALLGTLFLPGIGTAVGAFMGLVFGGALSWFYKDCAKMPKPAVPSPENPVEKKYYRIGQAPGGRNYQEFLCSDSRDDALELPEKNNARREDPAPKISIKGEINVDDDYLENEGYKSPGHW